MSDKVTIENREFTAERDTQVVLSPANPAGMYQEITVTMERGAELQSLSDGSQKVVADRYVASWNGKQSAVAASAKSAITGLLKVCNYGTFDDFVLGDQLDAEFFAKAPKANKPTGPSDEQKEQMVAANAALVDAQAAEGNAQDGFRSAGAILASVRNELGGQKTKKWFESDEAQSLVPALIALGNTGKNAISDFCSFGTLPDNVFARLSRDITQGKVADNKIREVIGEALENAGTAVHDEFGGVGDMPTAEALSVGARAVIDYVLNMGGAMADYGSVSDGVGLLVGLPVERTDNSLRAAVFANDIAEAVELANAFNALADAKSDGKPVDDAEFEKASVAYRRAIFVKRLVAATNAAGTRAANMKREDSALEAVSSEDNAKIEAKTKLKDRAAIDVAAQVFNTIKAHPAIAEVYRDLGIMVRDYLEAEKAAAEAEKAA